MRWDHQNVFVLSSVRLTFIHLRKFAANADVKNSFEFTHIRTNEVELQTKLPLS